MLSVVKTVPNGLSVIRDSLFQFKMMTMEDDFIRSAQGGDHQRRELLRVNVLLGRIKKYLPMVAGASSCIKQLEHLIDILEKSKGTVLSFYIPFTVANNLHDSQTVFDLQYFLSITEVVEKANTITVCELTTSIVETDTAVKECRIYLESLQLPQHRY